MFPSLKTTALLALLVTSSLAIHSLNAFAQTTNTIDVAVTFENSTGKLAGALMQDGQPLADQTVWLQPHGSPNAPTMKTTTNEHGKFAFSLNRGGVYAVRTGKQAKVCRVWPARQAPPAAVREVLLTSRQTPIVRGQDYVTFEGEGCGSSGQNGVPGGFQYCDSSCGEPPRLSNCDTSGGGFLGCGCKGGCHGGCCGECGGGFLGGGGRSKLLLGLLGGAIIGYAIDQDDGPIDAEVGS